MLINSYFCNLDTKKLKTKKELQWHTTLNPE